jgi:hypothetical protein
VGRVLYRVGAALVVLLMVVLIWRAASATIRARAPRAIPPALRRKVRPGGHDWEPRTDRVSRKLKGVAGPSEDRQAILRFVESRRGVEAFVEPKTVVSDLSVVLVADDGEWSRFPLADDGYLRELARTHGLPVFDATRVGYPKRMREYRRRPKETDG